MDGFLEFLGLEATNSIHHTQDTVLCIWLDTLQLFCLQKDNYSGTVLVATVLIKN